MDKMPLNGIAFTVGNGGFALKIKQGRVNFAYGNVNFTYFRKSFPDLLCHIHRQRFQQRLRNIHPVFYQLV